MLRHRGEQAILVMVAGGKMEKRRSGRRANTSKSCENVSSRQSRKRALVDIDAARVDGLRLETKLRRLLSRTSWTPGVIVGPNGRRAVTSSVTSSVTQQESHRIEKSRSKRMKAVLTSSNDAKTALHSSSAPERWERP